MPEKIISLASLTYMRAQLLSAMLERNGLSCFIRHTNDVEGAPGAANVMIDEKDVETAVRIYEDFISSYGKAKEPAVKHMKAIRRILVPVDFTLHSENAAMYAVKIASTLKADIKLVTAYLDPMGTPQTYLESYTYQLNIDKVIREVEEETYKSLEAMRGRVRNFATGKGYPELKVVIDLFKGNAVDMILGQVETYKPGMVIMGTRGSELDRFRSFGSVTSHLIEKARVPVLAIPKDYDSNTFVAPKKVLYATDFDTTDYIALRRLVGFVKPFGAKLYCVHGAIEEAEKMDEVKLKRIRAYLSETIDTKNIECGLLETMDIQQGLEDFIKEHRIDVLALTKQKRNFFMRLFKPSMTKKFLFQTHIPLLVFQSSP